ncbi:S1-C subfamily serine protease [Hydrogenophaga palleronii]|uniref:S1-C subfamily serine protease n=1 Tax=Hydrogenophaga palleronii TaxID=65655 RepID=A0ABU1WN91_9BURK|nr:trypsin-like peptidase domain-containing protein [Hydrogenophaga palleronii]MDR7150775.1 S1-C subfamily serine protease [Hydrogenophaga palleronii]
MFSTHVRELKSLVGASKLAEADDYFNRNATFFVERYKEGGNPMLPELTRLAEHVWETRYASKVAAALEDVGSVTAIPAPGEWPSVAAKLNGASLVVSALKEDRLLRLTKQGAAQSQALFAGMARVAALALAAKPQAVQAVTASVIDSGKHDAEYVGTVALVHEDFVSSPAFQEEALKSAQGLASTQEYESRIKLLAKYLSPQSKEAADRAYVERVRRQLYADGRITLEEVGALSSAKPPFGSAAQELKSLVKIGYVDLTSASFKNRNVFDFEIAFKQDIESSFEPATEAIFTDGSLNKFDFVFVTDLSAAKVAREFKSRQEIKSRFQSGTRETANPDYVGAMTNYQTAMAQYQRVQINSAIPKACQGWGCVLQGIADGVASSSARNQVDQASAALAGTPQTLTIPVYSEYAYQAVDIKTTKTAQVDYFVIDVKAGQTLRNSFAVNDGESFNVAYNVRDEDPDKSSITRNLTNEQEVTDWEKRPMPVSLSALFGPDGLKTATRQPFNDVQSFLQSLNTRTYAPSSPTYASSSSSTMGPAAMVATSASSPASAQTIADERFDSIVVVRTSKAGGTGFYVTPDLILTAFHVVDGSSLVEIVFYDGTKSYGRVVDHDIRLDLALVRPQATGKPLRIHEGPLRLGETVEAIGHPKGYEFTITRGVISAVRKQKSATISSANLVEFVQTDTPISPGNSGGPLLLKDVVIGVNDWIRVDKGSQNLNFSVSFNEIRTYLNRFQAR